MLMYSLLVLIDNKRVLLLQLWMLKASQSREFMCPFLDRIPIVITAPPTV